ncbi:MAG: L,D-transpeptidase [Anaerolineales bacterium]|nr:L,D-transpeptidase [Anaerolineales bacterium]
MAGSAAAFSASFWGPGWAEAALRRFDEPGVVREIRRTLQATFQDHEMSLYFSHLEPSQIENFVIEIQPDRLYPMASSFKSAAVLYYYLYTPQEVWNDEPGSAVYSMAVFSNNQKTGYVLAEVANRLKAGNPIIAFNNFLLDPAYLGLHYGLYGWDFLEFSTPTNGYRDDRFDPDNVLADNLALRGVNHTSAAEIARIFRFLAQASNDPRWESNSHFQNSILATRQLLSVTVEAYVSSLERAIAYTDHYSKEGILRPVEVGTTVRNDAGVWLMEDGGSYLISLMSATETDETVNSVMQQVAESIRLYQRYQHPNDYARNTSPSSMVYPGELNYGFVRETGVPLYTAPGWGAPRIDNPVRSSSIFGTTYLMYGALVRFFPHENGWVELIPDDRWDDSFPWPVYMRMEALQVIDRDVTTAPLGHITGGPEEIDKFILLDIFARDMILFEGLTPILRTPVIVNTENTPRKVSALQRAYISRDMPNYPGVPFSTFLHGSAYLDQAGFAIHGSPWHLWAETVRQETILRRFTHGCINLPDWVIPIPHLGHGMRVDEFIFRWAGGFTNPATETVYANGTHRLVRLLALDNPQRDIYEYATFSSLRASNASWDDVLQAATDTPITAPDSFFQA